MAHFKQDKVQTLSLLIGEYTPGLYTGAITVTETDANGCIGTAVVLDIYLLQPAATQIGPFCKGDPCVALVGTPAGGVWTGTGVVLNGACI